MKCSHVAIVCLIATVLSDQVWAATSAEQRASQIAPLITDQTIVVIHADLKRLDLKTVEIAQQAILGAGFTGDVETFRGLVEPLLTEIVKLRASDVYVVLSADDLPMPRTLVAFAVDDTQQARVKEVLSQGMGDRAQVEVLHGLAVVAAPRVIRELQQGQASTRPEIVDAFRGAGDSAAQLLFIPHADIRRAIAEITRWPEALGRDTGHILANGIQWAALSVDLQPAVQVTLTASAKDVAAAEKLQQFLLKGLRLAADSKATPLDATLLEQIGQKLTVRGNQLVWESSEREADGGVVALLKQPVQQALESANRARNSNQLKQLGLAMHNYHDSHQHLPPQAIVSADNQPLLSWRVAILPFVDQGELYKQFHLDEPWDSEHNRQLVEKMPDVFARPGAQLKIGYTTYVVSTGPYGLYTTTEGIQLREILDGTSNVILIADMVAEEAVIWTKPNDLQVDPEHPFQKIAGPDTDGFFVTLCDGSVQFFRRDMDPEILLRYFQPRDGKRLVKD